jgi:hypothetical protein
MKNYNSVIIRTGVVFLVTFWIIVILALFNTAKADRLSDLRQQLEYDSYQSQQLMLQRQQLEEMQRANDLQRHQNYWLQQQRNNNTFYQAPEQPMQPLPIWHGVNSPPVHYPN